jgi:hypothetical protein
VELGRRRPLEVKKHVRRQRDLRDVLPISTRSRQAALSDVAIGNAIADTRSQPIWRTWPVACVAGAVVLFMLSYALTLLSDIETGRYLLDKSWFLHVVNRVTAGDVLYRDMFFGVPPLSIYLTVPVTQLFGNAYLVAEAWWTGWLVVGILVSLQIARQLGWGNGALALLALAQIVFMVPWIWSPYSLLAMMWLLICCSATLAWIGAEADAIAPGRHADTWLVIAGAAAGLCFASKQNLGVCVIGALGVAALACGGGWAARRQWPRRFVLTAAPCLIVVVAFLLPVFASGGGEGFVGYGFAGLGTFARMADYAYETGLSEIARLLSGPPSIPRLEALYWQLLYLLPPVAFVALLIAWLRSGTGERDRAVIMLVFTLAATMMIYPRTTLSHLVYATPMLLLGLGYGLRQLVPDALQTHGKALGTACGLWLLLGAALIIVEPATDLANGDYELSQLSHYHGMPFTNTGAEYFRTAEKLSELSAEREAMLVISLRAGFLYLASGLENPTPFDYPVSTAFGLDGETRVVEAITSGEFQEVCLDHDFSTTSDPRRLQPREVLSFVEQKMDLRRDLAACAIYRYRP